MYFLDRYEYFKLYLLLHIKWLNHIINLFLINLWKYISSSTMANQYLCKLSFVNTSSVYTVDDFYWYYIEQYFKTFFTHKNCWCLYYAMKFNQRICNIFLWYWIKPMFSTSNNFLYNLIGFVYINISSHLFYFIFKCIATYWYLTDL